MRGSIPRWQHRFRSIIHLNRFVKGRRASSPVTGQHQISGRAYTVSRRTGLVEIVGYLRCAVLRIGAIELFHGVCCTKMQTLTTWGRQLGQKGLADLLMDKDIAYVATGGSISKDTRPFGLIERIEKRVFV